MSKDKYLTFLGVFLVSLFCLVITREFSNGELDMDALERLALNKVALAQAPKQVWSVGIFRGRSPFELSADTHVRNPVVAAENVTDIEASLVAHPFLLRVDSGFFMFFTAKNAKSDLGEIGLAESDDGLSWRYRQIVLKKPYHLAYPFVFEWQGSCYMIPEGVEDKSVRLYRATEFPTEWTLERVLLSGESYISASVIQYEEVWWMFVGMQGNEKLRLYYADQPTGPWIEHPFSPIVEANKNTARPGGRPLVLNGELFRLGQDCFPTYGYSVSAFRVNEISRTTYSEEMVQPPVVEAAGEGWAAEGMHHVDALHVEEGVWIAAVDGFQTVR